MSEPKIIKNLVLHLSYPSRASYNQDWVDAFREETPFESDFFNIFSESSFRKLKNNIKLYDSIVILHSCTADSLYYIKKYESLLKERKGILIAFVGNEYNMPTSFLSQKSAFLKAAATDIIASQLLKETAEWVYQGCARKVISLPHALNSKVFFPTTPLKKRELDIGIRTFAYPAYLGDNERNDVTMFFEQNAARYFLSINSSFSKRLTRENWRNFLGSSKGVVSTEAGTWYLERDDAIIKKIRNFYDKNFFNVNDTYLRKIANITPYKFKEWIKWWSKRLGVNVDIDFFSGLDPIFIREKFFSGVSPCPYYSKCISSRHFDAIGTKTVQILLEGKYNNILCPHKNYLSLKRDFSNVDEVLEKFRDLQFCETMVENTYTEFLERHTYKHRILELFEEVNTY